MFPDVHQLGVRRPTTNAPQRDTIRFELLFVSSRVRRRVRLVVPDLPAADRLEQQVDDAVRSAPGLGAPRTAPPPKCSPAFASAQNSARATPLHRLDRLVDDDAQLRLLDCQPHRQPPQIVAASNSETASRARAGHESTSPTPSPHRLGGWACPAPRRASRSSTAAGALARVIVVTCLASAVAEVIDQDA